MAPPLNKILKIIFVLVIGFRLAAPYACHAKEAEYVRVAIIQDAPSLNLKIKGFYAVIDSKTQKVLYRGKNLNTAVITYKEGILLGGAKAKTARLLIKSDDPDAIMINGRLFRGNIGLIKKDEAHLLVVNHIGMEDYIKGILYNEASHYWPAEALKAQAVACRTFASYAREQSRNKEYDLTADIYSQVYGGRGSERYRTNKAVKETEGRVLAYKGKIFPAYYHATCGGHTEDASLLWKIDIEPLGGVACSFCKGSPHFKWHYVLSAGELREQLRQAGYKFNKIDGMAVSGQDASGRITGLKVISRQGKETDIAAKDFRSAVGPNLIRSTNFSLNSAEHDFIFEGFGWGHGVGLCQWGAYFMAKDGYKYEQILNFYYPASSIILAPKE